MVGQIGKLPLKASGAYDSPKLVFGSAAFRCRCSKTAGPVPATARLDGAFPPHSPLVIFDHEEKDNGTL